VLAAHVMFELPVWQFSGTVRAGLGQWFAEAVATFGLVLVILGCLARRPVAIPYAVGLYITAAYWFTASTSFANPAVTIARSLSDTFAGIAPGGVLAFIVAQLVGMGGASGTCWVAVARFPQVIRRFIGTRDRSFTKAPMCARVDRVKACGYGGRSTRPRKPEGAAASR
jgi:hypothetical protein